MYVLGYKDFPLSNFRQSKGPVRYGRCYRSRSSRLFGPWPLSIKNQISRIMRRHSVTLGMTSSLDREINNLYRYTVSFYFECNILCKIYLAIFYVLQLFSSPKCDNEQIYTAKKKTILQTYKDTMKLQ